MRQVITYIANDGETFDTAAECVSYEQIEGVLALAKRGGRDYDEAQDIADFVTANWPRLCEIMVGAEN